MWRCMKEARRWSLFFNIYFSLFMSLHRISSWAGVWVFGVCVAPPPRLLAGLVGRFSCGEAEKKKIKSNRPIIQEDIDGSRFEYNRCRRVRCVRVMLRSA